MAEPPFPPPDPPRPFDWQRDDPEWGEEGMPEDRLGCLMVSFGAFLLAVAMVVLYLSLLR